MQLSDEDRKTMMGTAKKIGAAILLFSAALLATEPNRQTRRWWSHIQALANDGMEGRDTGSAGYRKAASYVVREFERNGLNPGEQGFLQTVPLHVIRVRADRSKAELVRDGRAQQLQWFRQITVQPTRTAARTIDADLVFVGASNYSSQVDVRGKIVLLMSPPRVENAQTPALSAVPAGAIGILGIDSPEGLEPARWPAQYAVAMSIRNPN